MPLPPSSRRRVRRAPVAALAALFLFGAACADDPVPAPAPREDRTTPDGGAPETPARGDEAFRAERVELGTRVVVEGLESPIGIAHADDGSERLFVIEQGGRIQLVEDGSDSAQVFLDISDRLVSGGEQGLLGLAFHPSYEDNGRLFVNYTDRNGDTVVSEFHAADDSADPESERVLLQIDQPFDNHNGGHLAFGPDGYLYIATGDGGSGGDPENNGQSLDTLLGKLLRIDVDARDEGPYGIPQDNPFVEDDEARPEIWAYGLRNPWRFSFDRKNDDLWIGDVGQGEFEEVNREPAGSSGGRNYGWRPMEGASCYEDDCDPERYVAPVMTYSHDFGCSITGGYVYRGDRYENLRGAYITADYCSGLAWALPADIEDVHDPEPVLETGFNIPSFGEDEAGELYLTDSAGGRLLQVVDEKG